MVLRVLGPSMDGFSYGGQWSGYEPARARAPTRYRYYRSLLKKGTLLERSQHRFVTAPFPS